MFLAKTIGIVLYYNGSIKPIAVQRNFANVIPYSCRIARNFGRLKFCRIRLETANFNCQSYIMWVSIHFVIYSPKF